MKSRYILFALILALLTHLNAFSEELVKIEKVENKLLDGQRILTVCCKNGLTVWATHNFLVVYYPDGSQKTFDSSNSPLVEAATISDAAISDQRIWVTQINSTNGYGIFMLDGDRWQVFKDPDKEGILNNRIMKIHVDQDEKVWFGNEHQGVTFMVEAIPLKFENQKIIHLFENRLLSLFMQQTHLWIGTSNGVVRYRSEIKSNYYLNIDVWKYPEFPARSAFSLCEYQHNTIVAGTDIGLAIFNGKKWRLIRKKAGIKALPAKCLLPAGQDIWIGSPVGLQRWNPSRPSRLFNKTDGLPGNGINAICLDKQGNILIATDKGPAIAKIKQP
ncbi:MAG: hypothetical protein Kow0029_20640 [Candidatus Rifleibacteriota bacterium]